MSARRGTSARAGDVWSALNDAHSTSVGELLRRATNESESRHEAIRKKKRIKLDTDLGDPEGGPPPMSYWTPSQRRGFFGMVGALGEALSERVYRPRDPRIYHEQRLRESAAHIASGSASISLRSSAVGNRRYARDDGNTNAFSGVLYKSASELQQPRHLHKPRLTALFDARFMCALPLLDTDQDAALDTLFGDSIDEIGTYGMLTGEQKGLLTARNEHGAVLSLCSELRKQRPSNEMPTLTSIIREAQEVHGLAFQALAVRCDGALELILSLDGEARRFATLRLDIVASDSTSAVRSVHRFVDANLEERVIREIVVAEVQREHDRDAPATNGRHSAASGATIGSAGAKNTLRRQMAQVAAKSGSISDAEFGNALFIALGNSALAHCETLARTKAVGEHAKRALETGRLARANVDGRLIARSTELLLFDVLASKSLAELRVRLRYHYFVPCQCDLSRKWLRRYAALYDMAASGTGPPTTFARTDFSREEERVPLRRQGAGDVPVDIATELSTTLRKERRQRRKLRRAQRNKAERDAHANERYKSSRDRQQGRAKRSACAAFYEAVTKSTPQTKAKNPQQ